MLNYYAVEKALRTHVKTAEVVAQVWSTNRIHDVPRLFEQVAASPAPQAAEYGAPHGAVIMFYSGLDSVKVPDARSNNCEVSYQEWHLFVTTKYHGDDVERYNARQVNGDVVSKVIMCLKDFDWLKAYYALEGQPDTRVSSKIERVTADKLLVAEEKMIESPNLVNTLLAYRAMLSSAWTL